MSLIYKRCKHQDNSRQNQFSEEVTRYRNWVLLFLKYSKKEIFVETR